MIKNQKKATIFALVAVAMWSTVASAFKITLDYFAPIQMLLVASCTTILVLVCICYQQRKLHLVKQYFLKSPLYYLILGLINPCLYYLILFEAYNLLPAQQAQSLNYTWAITLSILAVPFLGQKLSKKDIAAICFAYGGALVIATKGDLLALDFSSPLGVFLALLSTLFWAMYWILNTKRNGDPIVSLLLCFLLGLPAIVILTPILSDFNMHDWQGWAGSIYIGLFEMGFAFVAWLTALRYAENTSKVSNLIFISPFVSLLLLNLIINEPIFPATIVGLVLIISGLLIQQIKNK
jgi:drug/metabolite transporter (DMT)-like permease